MRELQRQGRITESFEILLTGGAAGDLDDEARSLGATLHYLPFSRRNFRLFAEEFRRLLRERQYIAIHDHQDYSAGWHLFAGAGSLPPVRVVHVHNPPARFRAERRTPIRRVALSVASRLVRRLSTHIVGTSSQIVKQYGFLPAAFPNQRISTIHCGFDTRAFLKSTEEANASVCAEVGWPQGTKIALFVGRLDGLDPSTPGWNHKNPQFALEVARLAAEKDSSFRFIMVGGGEDVRRNLAYEVERWGLSSCIKLVGKRLDVARYMAASHTLIFPSLEEGLGMVAVEAQAAGLRVLSSDTVPAEIVVVPKLVTFLALAAGTETWCTNMLDLLSRPRYDIAAANRDVRSSPYSIDYSYDNLHAIYDGSNAVR
jgi:glycosyltransferase involved in cell wall biosynthesis